MGDCPRVKYQIGGNEKPNSAAKSALELPHAKVGVPYTDFKYCISQYILSTHLTHSYILKKDSPSTSM